MISKLVFPPSLVMLLGAFLIPFLPKKWRSWFFVLSAFVSLLYVWFLPEGGILSVRVMHYELILCRVDALSRVFGIIFAFIALAGSLYAFHVKDTRQHVAALLYAGCALGVTFSGDFFTLFIFWELMAVASTVLIWSRRDESARKAGMRYLLYHVLGGGILFMGLLMFFSQTGQLGLTRLSQGGPLFSWLILIGVIINAAVPPFHTWLSDAYPKATVTGAVFLSAFTTKTAVYVLVRIFPGWEVLLIMGTLMTLYGVVFAVLSNDIRGILAYHIISQVGYMVAGVGLGTEMALNGSTAHAFSHILYKALLFMGAGAVLYATGESKLTKLGGLHGQMRPVLILYMIAAFSISGVPLFNGFISKSMVTAAAGESHQGLAMLLMLLASVGTFLSVGLKLPYFTWLTENKGAQPKKLPFNMILAMGLVAFFCCLHGIVPSLLYRLLPYPVHFEPYSIPHLVETVQILILTLFAFWLFRKKLSPHADITLDLDWCYRRPAGLFNRIFVEGLDAFFKWTTGRMMSLVEGSTRLAKNPISLFSRSPEKTPFSPDEARPKMQSILIFVLLTFVVLVLIGLLVS